MSYGLSLAFLVAVLGQFEPPVAVGPSETETAVISSSLEKLHERVSRLKRDRNDDRALADVEIFVKAGDWILRHEEFFDPKYAQWTIETLKAGLHRADELETGKLSWFPKAGSTVLAYYSQVEGSVQPYAVTLPRGYDPSADHRWPLHVELHGRNAKLNEVSFIHQYDGKPLKDEPDWIQLDIFGRTNNAYRWAGETDVFEAIAALKHRVKIDDSRITLHGFSMGGAGVWHLGMHHPSIWSSIGAGAGFVDTVHHLKLEMPLSPIHQKLTKIYDAQEYALNAFNVPTIGYGGDLDPQLFAGKTMHAKGLELGLPIQLLIGPETAHKFHPESLKQFMAFLASHSERGRLPFPNPAKLKFVTYTLKYNQCEWLTIEEQIKPYEMTVVEADVDANSKTLKVSTKNVANLQIRKEVADAIVIDGGDPLPLNTVPASSLPGVYFEKRPEGWRTLDSNRSQQYAALETPEGELRKRHDLQGPIDDAFMQPFVCVRPTGKSWSDKHAEWANWTLHRFETEFDHRLRGQIQIVNDKDVTDEILQRKHLVLFGDPGSNSVLANLAGRLPVKWSKESFEVSGKSYPFTDHGLAMIYPNPLNPKKYVVVNSGHTFHEAEFTKSNANLYPRLGDISVIQFAATPEGLYKETVLFSDLFDSRWKFESK